ncbi:MAG: hypothetical protein ACRBK7_12330 [Acidimicrobiales bacterium]
MAELLNAEKKTSRSFNIRQIPGLALIRNAAIVVAAFWIGVAFAAYSDEVPGDVLYAAKRAAEQPARIVDPGIVVNNRVEELGELISRGADPGMVLTARLDATNALAGTNPDDDLTRVFGLLAWPGLPPGHTTDTGEATEAGGLLISKSEWFNENGYTAALVDGHLVTISAVDGEILIGTSGGWSAFTTGTGWRLASDDVAQVYTIDRVDGDALRVIPSGSTDSASGAGEDELLAGRAVFGQPLSGDEQALAGDEQGWPTTSRSTTSQPNTSQSQPTLRPSGNAAAGSTTSQRTAGQFEPRGPATSATSSTTDAQPSSTSATGPGSTVLVTTRPTTTPPTTTRTTTTRPTTAPPTTTRKPRSSTTASSTAPSTTRQVTSRPSSTAPPTTQVATTRTTATTTSTTVTTVAPTTAPPSTTTTTTAPPVVNWSFFLDSSSSGNTSSSRNLPLRSGSAPSGPLRNFDTNRDSFPGLMIQKDGAGLSTSDSSKNQEWSVAIPDPTRFDGSMSLTIWLAAKDFKTDERIGLLASLDLCSPGCTRLGTGQWSGGGEGGFRKATVGFGSVDRVVPAGSTLRLKVVVPDGLATTDVWFAYDSGSHPSRINIG